ncbi:MAG: hypothetical protein ACLSX2_05840, partial [Christensenellaceae bacterium]
KASKLPDVVQTALRVPHAKRFFYWFNFERTPRYLPNQTEKSDEEDGYFLHIGTFLVLDRDKYGFFCIMKTCNQSGI